MSRGCCLAQYRTRGQTWINMLDKSQLDGFVIKLLDHTQLGESNGLVLDFCHGKTGTFFVPRLRLTLPTDTIIKEFVIDLKQSAQVVCRSRAFTAFLILRDMFKTNSNFSRQSHGRQAIFVCAYKINGPEPLDGWGSRLVHERSRGQ